MTAARGTVPPADYKHALIPAPGMSLTDTKVQQLNAATPRSRTCAWPHCNEQLTGHRVGILCRPHADQVADAVLEDRVINRYFEVHGETVRMDQLKQQQSAEQHKHERWELQRAEDAEQRRGEPGWVYYLRVGDRVKIGFSTDVRRRLRSYPPGSELLAVEPGTLALEAERHRQFRQYLQAGREWFRPDAALLEHITDLADMHGRPARFAR